jgi:hypothetical protein
VPPPGAVQYQVVHVNSEYANQVSDHDPQLVRVTVQSPLLQLLQRLLHPGGH